MLVALDKVIRLRGRGLEMIGGRVADLGEKLVLEKGSGNDGKITCRRIVVFVKEAVGVYEMCVGAAKQPGLLVHHARKSVHAARHVFGHGVCHLVCGSDHDAVETFLHGQRLVFVDSHVGASGLDAENGVMGEGHHLVHGGVLHCDKAGHELGGACRVQPFIHVFGVEHDSGVCLQQNGGLGAYGGAGRPVLDLIALDFKGLPLFRQRQVIDRLVRFGRGGKGF